MGHRAVFLCAPPTLCRKHHCWRRLAPPQRDPQCSQLHSASSPHPLRSTVPWPCPGPGPPRPPDHHNHLYSSDTPRKAQALGPSSGQHDSGVSDRAIVHMSVPSEKRMHPIRALLIKQNIRNRTTTPQKILTSLVTG